MKTINNTWKLQSLDFNTDLNKALQQQHHAAQFIALVGKRLIFQESDDSNTNMEFVFGKDTLVGNEMPNGFRLSLNIKNQELNKEKNNSIYLSVIWNYNWNNSMKYTEIEYPVKKTLNKVFAEISNAHISIINDNVPKQKRVFDVIEYFKKNNKVLMK